MFAIAKSGGSKIKNVQGVMKLPILDGNTDPEVSNRLKKRMEEYKLKHAGTNT